MPQEIVVPAVVVLVGPSGSGKSTWAAAHFDGSAIVSSDALRAVVGLHEGDQKASADAFAVLEAVVSARVRRRLTTVIDTLGLQPADRTRWIEMARRAGIGAYAVAFDTPPAECRRRNKAQPRPVPASVLRSQIERYAEQRPQLTDDGFDATLDPGSDIRLVNTAMAGASELSSTQRKEPVAMDFGLQISSFEFAGGSEQTAAHLGEIARNAEAAGFTTLWVMDHFLQIPQIGPEWKDMLEGYTTLAYLAGVTSRIGLGTMVTGVGYRNPALLGKMIATLDVLSGGRAMCGIGAGWFEREAVAYGWPVESVKQRLDRLEDVLQLLPLLWGPGSPGFEGATFSVPEAICYPRPLQEHIPILVGGGGEKRTLRLVAQYADMTNLFGDASAVRHKLAVLDRHCADVGRDRTEITVTHLGPALVGSDDADLARRLADMTPPNQPPESFAATLNAGTVDDHIGRLRGLAEAGVQTEIVALPDLDSAGIEAIDRFAPVMATFS